MRWLLALSLVFVACGDSAGPVTEIVVYVDADDAVRGRATGYLVTVAGRAVGETTYVEAETIELTSDVLPFQFNFAPLDGDLTREWRVGVRAEDDAGTFAEKTLRGAYAADESRVLYLVLRGPCIERACASEQTCVLGSCTSDSRSPSDLPLYEGGRVPPPDMPEPVCTTDGECDDGLFCNGPSACDPGSAEADARGCVDGDPPCPPPMSCDESGMMCVEGGCEMPDEDDDGVARPACGGDDCDDLDENNYPGNTPIDDDADNDCDGDFDEGFGGCPTELEPEDDRAACTDGCDNDGDDLRDCDDYDCAALPECGGCGRLDLERSDEACMDECDNDGSGFVDCEDFTCDGFAGCTGCGCAVDQACLTRRAYGFVGVCGSPCTVGEGIDVSDPSTWGRQGGCPSDADTCWWRGIPDSRDGVCATPSSVLMPPNFGDPCSSDSSCASPFGWGTCLTPAVAGFPDGYCALRDCAAPGAPVEGAGLCGSDSECVQFENTSYCLEACAGASCRPGYGCISGLVPDGGVCLPRCTGSGTCGSRGRCVIDLASSEGYCQPPSSF